MLYLQLLLFLWLPEWRKETESMKSAGAKAHQLSESAEAEEDISQEVQQEAVVSTFADAYEDEAAAKPAVRYYREGR